MSFPNVKARMAFFAKQKDKSGQPEVKSVRPDIHPGAKMQNYVDPKSLAMLKPPSGPKPLPNEPKSPSLPKMAKFPKIRKFFKG